jgi:hypothetical protein
MTLSNLTQYHEFSKRDSSGQLAERLKARRLTSAGPAEAVVVATHSRMSHARHNIPHAPAGMSEFVFCRARLVGQRGVERDEFILGQLGRGLAVDEVVKEYGVPREDVLAAVRFAANTVGRDAYLAPER